MKPAEKENNVLKIGIVGLGLIGGSFAKAYHAAGHEVYVRETDANTLSFARADGTVTAELDRENIGSMDLILLAVYPEAALEFLREEGLNIGEKPLVIDCCGVKAAITGPALALAKKHGFTFVGGHPMAGTQYSGYKYARANLFHNAPMVLVPEDHNDLLLISRAKALLSPCGFSRYSVTSAEAHDSMIAFTSQLAHVVSNAYIKSPSALRHKGFSAGSYKDLTRVAHLNPTMWTELFFENKDFLLNELDILMKNLDAYREALIEDDKEKMFALLKEGSDRKNEVDS